MILNDTSLLHPKMVGPTKRLHEYLIDCHETHRTQFRFEIFETFRSPVDQRNALTKGVSKAGPWQSAHQFGLAVDFVPYLNSSDTAIASKRINKEVRPGWFWEIGDDHPDWMILRISAEKFGLTRPISWDLPHVQHPLFDKIFKILA